MNQELRPLTSQRKWEMTRDELAKMVKESNLTFLRQCKGPVQLARALHSDSENGINGDDQDIKTRKKLYGSNFYVNPKHQSVKDLFKFLVQAFLEETPNIIILLYATLCMAPVITTKFSEPGWLLEGVGTLLFLVLSLSISVRQKICSHKDSESKIQSHQKDDIQVKVTRNRDHKRIPLPNVVVGDIVDLQPGDWVPGDGVLFPKHWLRLNLCPDIPEKPRKVVCVKEDSPFLYAYSMVMQGSGIMLITSVGSSTKRGGIITSIYQGNDAKRNPLFHQLESLNSCLETISAVISLIFIIVRLVSHYTTGADNHKDPEYVAVKTKIMQTFEVFHKFTLKQNVLTNKFLFMLRLIMGLPPSFAIPVALIFKHWKGKLDAVGAKVKNLSSIGSIPLINRIIINDTQLLVQKQIFSEFWLGGIHTVTDFSHVPSHVREALHQGVGLNTADAFPNDSLVLQYGFMDTATEKALLSGFTRMGGLDFSVNLMETHHIIHTQVLENRQCGVLIRDSGGNGNIFSHWKGHPKVILENCSRYYDNNGVETSMDVSIRKRVNDIVADMELKGLFCIAFAMKSSDVTIENSDLNLLGIAGLKQEIQEDARKEMQSFKEVGFNINITTDDDISAANSLASGCGFSESKNTRDHVVAIDNTVKIENVIAESSSYDEYKTVNCLKQRGDVVAVYGIESEKMIPVFAEANIGISTRIPCPRTKEEMSDMVISNNSLRVLHRIFVLARCCYPSIQKYLQLCLTVRIIWLAVTLFEAVSLVEAPIMVFQLLWVDFITGTIAALALGRENEESNLKPPIKRHKSLITKAMWRNIMGQVLHQIVVILFLQFQAEAIFNVNKDVMAALAFNTFFLCQIFNCFNVGIDWKRLWLMGTAVGTQVLMMQVLPLFTGTESLTLLQWVLCLGLAVLSIPANWVQKRIFTDLLI